MNRKPRFAVSILNWNGVALTRDCLRSVLDSRLQPSTVMVLDNGSRLNEAEVLQREFRIAAPAATTQRTTPRVLVERSDTNLGFARGHNAVLAALAPDHYDYIILLNQDAVVDTDCFDKLLTYLEANPQVAVAGPLVLNTDGTVQSCGADLKRWSGKVVSRYQGETPTTVPTEPSYVDVVIGNCFVLRRKALEKIGQLDERFFAYYEEADWCLRAQQAAWQCAVVPQAQIRHGKPAGFRTYLVVRNLIWFQKKHAGPVRLIFFFFYFWLYFIFERQRKGSYFGDLWKAANDGWLDQRVGLGPR
jgi:GT2 family glycosyltransferase